MINKIPKKTYMEHSADDIKELIYSTLQNIYNSSDKINWADWYIGLTIYPNNEKKQIGKPSEWYYWRAKSASDAKLIETYFLNKYPIKRGKHPTQYDYFVYIYKM